MKTVYIHIINGKIGGFTQNQICYANKPRKNGWHVKAVNSLEEIKEEQRKSREYRKKKGCSKSDYGYQIIEIDT